MSVKVLFIASEDEENLSKSAQKIVKTKHEQAEALL